MRLNDHRNDCNSFDFVRFHSISFHVNSFDAEMSWANFHPKSVKFEKVGRIVNDSL